MARGLKKKRKDVKDVRGRGRGGRTPGRGKSRGMSFSKKGCTVCGKRVVVDYKDVEFLRTLTTESGKLVTRRLAGICGLHQRQITRAIKRARHIALLPYERR